MTSIAPDIFCHRSCRLSVRHMESTSPSLWVRTSLQLSFSAPARARLRSTASRRWVGAGRGRGHLQRKVAAKFVPRAKQTWLPPRWVWLRRGRKQKGDGDTERMRTYTQQASIHFSFGRRVSHCCPNAWGHDLKFSQRRDKSYSNFQIL